MSRKGTSHCIVYGAFDGASTWDVVIGEGDVNVPL